MKKKINLGLLIKIILITVVLYVITFEIYDRYLKSYSLYQANFNRQREEMGIPLIDPLWEDSDKRDNFWVDRSFNHYAKLLRVEENNVNIEIDRFFLPDSSSLLVYSRYNRSEVRLISQRCEIMVSLTERKDCSCGQYNDLWK